MSKFYKANADYYDAEYEHSPMLQCDLPFFLGHLPRKKQCVLDVACGTGRASIPIAQAGHRVVGIDYDKTMIDRAIFKRDSVGLNSKHLELLKQDALKIKLNEKFDWATVFFNTFLNFTSLEHQDALLAGVHLHLRPRGRLWIDIFQPNLELLSTPESKGVDASMFYVAALDRTVQRSTDIHRDPSRQVQHITFHYRWFDGNGTEQHETSEFDLTFMFPRELQLLLERNGFELECIYGDYDGSKLTADSPRMIAMARVRKAAAR
ncbi:class I SAM-dependent methyltransferase [soil metagenome]